MMRLFFLICILFCGFHLPAQRYSDVLFEPLFGGQPLVSGQFYTNKNGDSIQVETFRFYLSHLRLLYQGQPVFAHPQAHFLVDVERPASLAIRCIIPADLLFDAVAFELGVDSLTQAAGALGGDLDPVHGMYWSWQSGYISAKTEGKASNCPAKGQQFQLHLGGYRAPWNTLTTLTFTVAPRDSVRIRIALDAFLEQTDLRKTYSIMRPGAEAVSLMQYLGQSFRTTP